MTNFDRKNHQKPGHFCVLAGKWIFIQNMEVSPQIIHFNWIFHEINHPFGGTTIYGNPHMLLGFDMPISHTKIERTNRITPTSSSESLGASSARSVQGGTGLEHPSDS